MLTADQMERYHRQMIIDGWGVKAQEKLKLAKVFIAGAGGLGSPVSIYLAVAGIQKIHICDCGEPELSNLNRQILHDDSRIGMNKAISAKQTLEMLNPDVQVTAYTEPLTEQNTAQMVGNVDMIVDCLDNFETRHFLNAYAVKKQIPMIHAGIYGMRGQVAMIQSPETPCLWCMTPGAPPPVTFPIVGAAAGVIGSIQALEAIKYLTGIGSNLLGRMLVWDGEKMEFQILPQHKDYSCPVCSHTSCAD